MRTRRVLDYVVPDNVPAGWEIYNAARPLHGEIAWQGDFISGVFYVAVNPDADDYESLVVANERLDASRIESVPSDRAVAEISEFYAVNFPTRWEKVKATMTRDQLIDGWYNRGLNEVDGN